MLPLALGLGLFFGTGAFMANHYKNSQRREAERSKSKTQKIYNQLNGLTNDYNTSSGDLQNFIGSMRNLEQFKNQDFSNKNQSLGDMFSRLSQHQSELGNVGQGLQNKTNEYQNKLSGFNTQKAQLESGYNTLQENFNAFTSQAPRLEEDIKNYNAMPKRFEEAYKALVSRKARLSGFNEDEMSGEVRQFKADVENLKRERGDTERKLKDTYELVTQQRGNLTRDRDLLTRDVEKHRDKEQDLKLQRIGLEGDQRLISDNINFFKMQEDQHVREEERNKQLAELLKVEMAKFQQEQEAQRLEVQNRVKGLKNLEESIGATKNSYNTARSEYESALGDYGRASIFSSITNAGLGALGGGLLGGSALGGSIGLTGGTGALVGGALAHQLSQMFDQSTFKKIMEGGNFEEAPTVQPIGSIADIINRARYAHTPISGGLLGNAPHVNIPEMGNLLQAIRHFDMPTIPNIQDLPQLSDALGKLVSGSDIEGLTLGLPTLRGRDGKGFNHAVLYDPSFLRKLKKVSKMYARKSPLSIFGQNQGVLSEAG